MQISLPYGHGHLPVEISDAYAPIVLEPRRGTIDPVRLALAAPIGSPRLRHLVRPGQSVVIVTSDVTRPCPTADLLPPVVEELAEGGIGLQDITVVFALGTHRAHRPAEHAALLGSLYGCVRAVDSDPNCTVYMGTTSRGTPLEVFEPVAQADVRIALGNIEYHYFAGYSGGYKALVPGVCSPRTIRHNHAMMCEANACLGKLDGNPVREDIDEAGAMIGLDFILNVIVDEGAVALATAGHPMQAHRWACAALDHLSMVPLSCCADVVLVSAGGHPKDINMYQAQKALDNAMAAVREGGVIIWVAECAEGLGNATFEVWMRQLTPQQILARIQEEFVLGGHKAAAIARVLSRAEIWLVSGLDPEIVRSCGFQPFSTPEAALEAAVARNGREASIVVMPEGASIVPSIP
jgi:lactate racemase